MSLMYSLYLLYSSLMYSLCLLYSVCGVGVEEGDLSDALGLSAHTQGLFLYNSLARSLARSPPPAPPPVSFCRRCFPLSPSLYLLPVPCLPLSLSICYLSVCLSL
jgi:hypothetical protein